MGRVPGHSTACQCSSCEPAATKPIVSAPRDGTFVRLFFRPGLMRDGLEPRTGQWQAHAEMPAGGAWFDRGGHYITPGPIAWAPEMGTYQ